MIKTITIINDIKTEIKPISNVIKTETLNEIIYNNNDKYGLRYFQEIDKQKRIVRENRLNLNYVKQIEKIDYKTDYEYLKINVNRELSTISDILLTKLHISKTLFDEIYEKILKDIRKTI